MTTPLDRWLPVLALASLLAAAVGCGSSARLSAGSRDGSPGARSTAAPLYVIPNDSLLALNVGTPVEVVLQSGGRVSGTSLRTLGDSPAEFRVRAPAKRAFAPADTVRIPITGIEVAVSTAPLVSGSERYTGPRKLGPLPRPGETLEDPVRHAIAILTIVALTGAVVLLGVFAIQETH